MTTRYRDIRLKEINASEGSQRSAFEELSYLLFARTLSSDGTPIRREGAGGDEGLEGYIANSLGDPIIGLQAKFFDQELARTQWRELTRSVETAILKNRHTHSLQRLVATIPRKLTKRQLEKWDSLVETWEEYGKECGYNEIIKFELWGESEIRELLLRDNNRGLLLHYFEYPDFGRERCRERTNRSINGLSQRYMPDLHVETDAENQIHVFLRSERSRQQFVEVAQKSLAKIFELPEQEENWGPKLIQSQNELVKTIEVFKSLLGDGVSLPKKIQSLIDELEKLDKMFPPFLQALRELIPAKDKNGRAQYEPYRQESIEEQIAKCYSEAYDEAFHLVNHLREYLLADANCLLLTGRAGSGKTHVLAEVATGLSNDGGCVLFMEGRFFRSGRSIWDQVIEWADFPRRSIRDFLATFSELAETNLPCLICIDALNETNDRTLWSDTLLDFASELADFPSIKLIVSCRDDYTGLTLPEELVQHTAPGWAFAYHSGLGIDVVKAIPKYISAYGVRGITIPPLAKEFGNPLFLRIFCETYQGRSPESGMLSLPVILGEYAKQKAKNVSKAVDCEPEVVLGALRGLGEAMMESGSSLIPFYLARSICYAHHPVAEVSMSLIRALQSEEILTESLGSDDSGSQIGLIRFTFERVWDYFLSVHLMPTGKIPDTKLINYLRNFSWRRQNAGLVDMLAIRLAGENNVELTDLIEDNHYDWEPHEIFFRSLIWRTHESWSDRTTQLVEEYSDSEEILDKVNRIYSCAVNSDHPRNAFWLHDQLMKLPLAERDRHWTFWVNEALLSWEEENSIRDLRHWADQGDLRLASDTELLLMSIALAWLMTTTVKDVRLKLAASLSRVVANRISVTKSLFDLFKNVNDPYVLERVLLACAGAAQNAEDGDQDLGDLASAIYREFFEKEHTPPHILVRHYASEVCVQAERKNALPKEIDSKRIRPPWKSTALRVWSEKTLNKKKSEISKDPQNRWGLPTLFQSVEPGPGIGYGDFGRYVMEIYVHQFQCRRLDQKAVIGDRLGHQFDQQRAKRFIIQRVFQLGWDWEARDIHPDKFGSHDRIERLSKKYQWIALFELLGHLCDNYHYLGWEDAPKKFTSAMEICEGEVLDPFVFQQTSGEVCASWEFAPKPAEWWRGKVEPFPSPLVDSEQRAIAQRRWEEDPKRFIELKRGEQDFLALHTSHRFSDPTPIWASDDAHGSVNLEWDIQSYLVPSSSSHKLISALSQREVYPSHLWIQQPEFGQSLSAMKSYPMSQTSLERRCCLDEDWETRSWKSRAIWTTCWCRAAEEQNRAPSGTIPSPQLAALGQLKWSGSEFGFVTGGSDDPIVFYMGEGWRGACVVDRSALCEWIKEAGYRIVWRCFCYKFVYSGHIPEFGREYWMSFTLDDSGEVVRCGGGTAAFGSKEEALPWN